MERISPIKGLKKKNFAAFSKPIIHIILTSAGIICIAPVVLVLITSFTSEKNILTFGYGYITDSFTTAFTFKAYINIFSQESILRPLFLQCFVTIVGTILSTIIVCFYAYAISRYNFRHRRFFGNLAYITLFIGPMSFTLEWYSFYTTKLPIKNTVWILIIPLLMNAWNILLMSYYIVATIPEELFEAAKLDSAGEFKLFFHIFVPLGKPCIATIVFFSFLTYWNDGLLSMMFVTHNDFFTLQYYAYNLLHPKQFLSGCPLPMFANIVDLPSENMRMAIVITLIIPIVASYLIVQKHIVKSIKIGASKAKVWKF